MLFQLLPSVGANNYRTDAEIIADHVTDPFLIMNEANIGSCTLAGFHRNPSHKYGALSSRLRLSNMKSNMIFEYDYLVLAQASSIHRPAIASSIQLTDDGD